MLKGRYFKKAEVYKNEDLKKEVLQLKLILSEIPKFKEKLKLIFTEEVLFSDFEINETGYQTCCVTLPSGIVIRVGFYKGTFGFSGNYGNGAGTSCNYNKHHQAMTVEESKNYFNWKELVKNYINN